MTGRIAWSRVVAEGLVIVISILLAFGIEAWWADKNDEQVSSGYVVRLAADLRQDTASLAYLARGLARKTEALRTLQMGSSSSEELANAVLQAEQYGWGQFTFNGTTFEELRSTGNLRLIQQRDLRSALVDYYEAWEFEQGRIAARRSELPGLIFKLLPIRFSAADDASAVVDENRALDLRDVGDADLMSLSRGVADPEFRRELQHELNYAGFAATALVRLHDEASVVLALLEAAQP